MTYTSRILNAMILMALIGVLAGCQYKVTINKTGQGTIALDPAGGLYNQGTRVTLTANPASGWYFDHWEGDLTDSTNPATIIVDSEKTATAVFVQNPMTTYALTANVTGQGSVGLNPASGTYAPGTVVTLTAIPASGWIFDHWEGGPGGGENPASVAIGADTTVTAVFVPAHMLTTSVVNGNGTLAPATGLQPANTSVSLTAAPDTGYQVKSWTGTDNDASTANTNTVNMTVDKTVTVEFEAIQSTLTYAAGANGTISGASPQTVIYAGSGTAVTAVSNTGYHFVSWSDSVSTAARTDTNVTGNISVTANFAANAYTLTLTPPANGTLTAVEATPYTYGEVVHLKATGNAGYRVKAWTGADTKPSTASTNTVTVTSDMTVAVEFEMIPAGTVLQTFSMGADVVSSVAFSPDDTKVLTGSYSQTAKLWDLATGNALQTFAGHTGVLSSVAFSPDGKAVLTGSYDKTAKLWDVTTGDVLQTLTGHTDYVTSVAFSPDGTKAMTGSYDKEMKLWDVATGNELGRFDTDNVVTSVAFSPDGTKAVAGSFDTVAKLFDISTPTNIAFVKDFTGHADVVNSVAFSPDGTKVLTGCYDKTAKLWDVATGNALQTFTGHTGYVTSVAFFPDGTKVLTGSYDKTAKLWDVSTGNVSLTFTGHTDSVLSVAFSPDGTKVLTGSADTTANLWFVSATPSGTVPYLVGKTQAGADQAIIGAGFILGAVTQAHSATVPTGDIISQDPPLLTNAVPGTAVNLVVSEGP